MGVLAASIVSKSGSGCALASAAAPPKTKDGQSKAAPAPPADPITFTIREKVYGTLMRDGWVNEFGVQGTLLLQIPNQEDGLIQVETACMEKYRCQFRTHPHIDKEFFIKKNFLRMKDPNRPFPTGQASYVLRWTWDCILPDDVPFTLECFPYIFENETYVSIKYKASSMFDLHNVLISVPLPALQEAPQIRQIDGEWSYDSTRSVLEWSILLVDYSNRSGSIEFAVFRADSSAFFPISVQFTSNLTYTEFSVLTVLPLNGGDRPRFCQTTKLVTENYQVVQVKKGPVELEGKMSLQSMGSGRIESSFSDMSISRSGGGLGSGSAFGLSTDVDSFPSKLVKGRVLASATAPPKTKAGQSKAADAPPTDPITFTVQERVYGTLMRDGGVHELDVLGTLSLQILNQEDGLIQVGIVAYNYPRLQFKTHPDISEQLFTKRGILRLKDPNRPFPTGQASDLVILMWRWEPMDELCLPLTINYWPSIVGNETYIALEYKAACRMQNLVISVPLPVLQEAPEVSRIDGEWRYDSERSVLEWSIPVIPPRDDIDLRGMMEFSVPAVDSSAFFPISVQFTSDSAWIGLKVVNVWPLQGENHPKFSQRTQLCTENYQVL